MAFCSRDKVARRFAGKRVVIVGSGPSVLENRPGVIDSHDVVVRVNNYKLLPGCGKRTDVFYSYFGRAIKKRPVDLVKDGVRLCIAKCPNAKFMDSEWHRIHGEEKGVDFRAIYRARQRWWFCDTYVPTLPEFLEKFDLLGGHVPTTGFAALLDVLSFSPASVYITGFDFFTSQVHNVNEPWELRKPDDPIRHVPLQEAAWVRENLAKFPISVDAAAERILNAL